MSNMGERARDEVSNWFFASKRHSVSMDSHNINNIGIGWYASNTQFVKDVYRIWCQPSLSPPKSFGIIKTKQTIANTQRNNNKVRHIFDISEKQKKYTNNLWWSRTKCGATMAEKLKQQLTTTCRNTEHTFDERCNNGRNCTPIYRYSTRESVDVTSARAIAVRVSRRHICVKTSLKSYGVCWYDFFLYFGVLTATQKPIECSE